MAASDEDEGMVMMRGALLVFAAGVAASVFADASDYSGYRTSDGTPQAVMLSYYDGPDTRGFTWQTADAVTTGSVWLCEGSFSSQDDITNQVGTIVVGASSVKHAGDCTTYKAAVTGLSDGVWSYCLGKDAKVACGQFTVTSAPTRTLTFVNLNDIQTKTASKLYMWENAVGAIGQVVPTPDAILSGGDFIDGSIDVNNVSKYVSWGVVADKARPTLADVPWIMASGNHDYSLYGDLVGEHYQLPNPAGCHAFDYGDVHIATLPVYGNSSRVSTSITNWLSADLQSATGATWRIVMLHAGPYTTGDHAASSSFIKQMTALFAQRRVDLVLQAHDHTYSRTLPYRWTGAGYTTSETDSANVNLTPVTTNLANAAGTDDGIPYYFNPEGTIYVSAGCAGHRVGEQNKYATRGYGTSSYDTHTYKTVTDTVKVKSSYGEAGADGSRDLGKPMFGVLSVLRDRLVFDWYVVESDGSGTLFDTLRICKEVSPIESVPTVIDPGATDPTVMPTIVPVAGTNGVYAVEVRTNATTTIHIGGLRTTDTVIVPEQIDTVLGVSSGQVVVVAEATNSAGTVAVDITKAFKVTDNGRGGVTILLDDDPAAVVNVTVGEQTEWIKVTPELTEADDATVAPLVVDDRIRIGVKTIPGLVYMLRRGGTLADVPAGDAVAQERAKGMRLQLADPMNEGKPPKAFYRIEVVK